MILFTDLDGTLLNDNKELSLGNRQAIDRALAAGHQIVISTGRPLCSAKLQAEKLNLTQEGCFIISYNGGQIYDSYHRKILFSRTLPFDQVHHIFEEAHQRGLHVQTYDENYVIAEEDRPELHHYSELTKVPCLVVPDIMSYLQAEPCKIIVINEDSKDILTRYREEMKPWTDGKMDLFFSSNILLEHVPTGVSKGSAVRFLCEHLNVPLSETVSAGDAENDIPMIQAVSIGAVMCNGDAGTKAYADYITENDNNHDGVAEIIEKFIL